MKCILILSVSALLFSANVSQVHAALSLPDAQAAIDSWYKQFLGRQPDPGAAGWVLALVHGQPPGFILADILSSREFFTRAGGTNAGFVNQLYKDQLGRPATAAELIFWTNRLLRSSRKNVAYEFLVTQGNILLVPQKNQNHRRHHR